MQPTISVVIATRERPSLLARCLARVLAQQSSRNVEVVVANDGEQLEPFAELADPRVTVVDTGGIGPGAARNRGVAAARGEVVLFTDDDALPDPGWLEAAAAALDASPDAVGVEGPIDGLAFDPLYEHSIDNDAPGAYFTCNVGYRRADFLAVGGFDLDFPLAHCEDVDLGRRLLPLGPILFVPAMRVVHPPRPIGFWELARRGRLVESEWRLHLRYPELSSSRWSARWAGCIGVARRWQGRLLDPSIVRGSPLRVLRILALGSLQLLYALHTALTRWRTER